MTGEEIDDLIEQVLTGPPVTVPAGFTDRVIRATRPAPWWRTPEFAEIVSSVVSSGALIAAGAAIWVSLGDGPLDASSLPVAVTGLALAMGGLAWLWLDDAVEADLKVRLYDLRPY